MKLTTSLLKTRKTPYPRDPEALETREFRVSEVRANHQRTENLIGLNPPSACNFLPCNHFFKKLEDLSNISDTRDGVSSGYHFEKKVENTTLSAEFWTKFEVSEWLMKHWVECLISRMEVKSSKSMLRPGIQTLITAVIFLVFTWWNTIEFEKSKSYQQFFVFIYLLTGQLKVAKLKLGT